MVAYSDMPLFGGSFAKSLALNLASEILGIILTVFLIDRVISKQHEAELKRRKEVALLRLKEPLSRHAQFLFHMFKATVSAKPKTELVQISDLFNDNFFASTALLNLLQKAPLITERGEPNWAYYLVRESKALHDSVGQFLSAYSFHSDVRLIELLETMLRDNFYEHVLVLQDIAGGPLAVGGDFQAFKNTAKVVFGPHVWAFQEIFEYFNRNAPNADRINFVTHWENHIAPPIGSARILTPTT